MHKNTKLNPIYSNGAFISVFWSTNWYNFAYVRKARFGPKFGAKLIRKLLKCNNIEGGNANF